MEDVWIPNGLAVSTGLYDKYAPLPYDNVQFRMSEPFYLSNTWEKVNNWLPTNGDVDYGWGTYSDGRLTITREVTLNINVTLWVYTVESPTSTRARFNRSGEYFYLTRRNVGILPAWEHTAVYYAYDLKPGEYIELEAMDSDAPAQASYIRTRYNETETASQTRMDVNVFNRNWQQSSMNFVFNKNIKKVVSGNTSFANTISYKKTGRPKVTEALFDTDVTETQEPIEDDDGNVIGYETVIDDYLTTTSIRRGDKAGPVLAQTRFPVPVKPGYKVNFSGQYNVRPTGSPVGTEADGSPTALLIRASIWGIGLKPDEYGVDQFKATELMFYMATLQPANSRTATPITYTLPTIPDATVPDGVQGVVFTLSYVEEATLSYATGTHTTSHTSSKNSKQTPDADSGLTYLNMYLDDRHVSLDVKFDDESNRVYRNTASATNVGRRGHGIYSNVGDTVDIVFMGAPFAAATINVYEYGGDIRGALLGSFTATAEERKAVTVYPSTDKIELDSTDDFYVESVLNREDYSLVTSQNRIEKVTFIDVTDDISKISIIREEGGSGSCTVDFCSNVLDPLTSTHLRIGKRFRVLGRHYGETHSSRPANWIGEAEYDEVFTGVIKRISTEYDYYEDEPIIQIIAYDGQFDVDMIKDQGAHRDFIEYGPVLNAIGVDAYVDGFNWGGKASTIPDKFLYFPAAHGPTLWECLMMTRNTRKSHVHFNRKNQLIINTEPVNVTEIVITDGSLPGDISYGNMERKQDSANALNSVSITEHLIDYNDFLDKTLSGGKEPPQNIQYPQSTTRTAEIKNDENILEVGEKDQLFDVVRGSGEFLDIQEENYGPGFKTWAEEILAQSNDNPMITKITIPIKSSSDIAKISKLDLLSRVDIVYKGQVQTSRIREIEHEIKPGHWHVELNFKPGDGKSFW